MQNTNQLLTEANYNKAKKKLRRISLIILIFGLLVGGGLITTGAILSNNVKRQNEETAQQIRQEADEAKAKLRTEAEIQADIDRIQSEIDDLGAQNSTLSTSINQLQNERSQYFLEGGFGDERYQAKDAEISNLRTEISANHDRITKLSSEKFQYESELSNAKLGIDRELIDTNTDIEISKNTISTHKYSFYYVIGGFIAGASCIIAFIIYITSKGREISAFKVQQHLPVAQEAITTMAPTVGKAAGSAAEAMAPSLEKAAPSIGKAYGAVAEGIARGIKKGINTPDSAPNPSSQDPSQPKQTPPQA